jgi:transcription antitermination factor NusG
MAAACLNISGGNRLPWFGVQTSLRKEGIVARHLEYKGYQVYLPTYSQTKQWSDRRVRTERALFPGYLFCRFDPRKPSIVTTPGAVSILGIGGRPQEVPEQEILSIQRMVQSRLPLGPHPYLRAGETIAITKGPLKGVTGVLVRRNDDLQVVVSVTLLQRSIAISLAPEAIGQLQ